MRARATDGSRARVGLLALALLLGATACHSSSQFVTVHVLAGESVTTAIQLQLDVSLGDTTRKFARPEAPGPPLAFPKTFSVEFAADAHGPVNVDVAALDASSATVAQGRGQSELPGAADITLTLGDEPLTDLGGTFRDDAGADAAGPDAALPIDRCHDAVKNGDETGIDCGGACPARCAFASCAKDADCVTGRCDGNVCQLAMGPPGWKAQPQLGTPRELMACATAGDGRLLAMAGNSDVGKLGAALASTESFAPGAAAWTAEAALPSARFFNHGFAFGGVPYAMGGQSSTAGMYYADLYAFVGNAWVGKTAAPGGLSAGFMIAGGNGKFYLPTGSNHVYDGATDAWSALSSALPIPRYAYAGSRGPDGRLYVIGGADASDQPMTSVEAYTVGAGWEVATPLPQGRTYPAAILAPDGQLYVMGGGLGANGISRDVAVLRLAENRWLAEPQMLSVRLGACATLANDGRIFVLGGEDAAGTLKAVEAYGPLVALAATSAAAGATVQVTGDNFAAGAPVAISLDDAPLFSLASTSATGSFAGTIAIPAATAPGAHVLGFVDARAQYPVRYPITVTP